MGNHLPSHWTEYVFTGFTEYTSYLGNWVVIHPGTHSASGGGYLCNRQRNGGLETNTGQNLKEQGGCFTLGCLWKWSAPAVPNADIFVDSLLVSIITIIVSVIKWSGIW